jgi:hypothetical protein
MDHFGFVQAIEGFGEGIIVGVPHAAHRGLDAGLGQALGVTDRHVLHAPDALLSVKG